MKNERDVTNFGNVFVPKFHIKYKSFMGDWTNICTVLFLFKNGILKNVKWNWKISYRFWKIYSFEGKKDRLSDYWTFWILFGIVIMQNKCSWLLRIRWDFFQIFVISREILKFWSNQTIGWECTVPYILKKNRVKYLSFFKTENLTTKVEKRVNFFSFQFFFTTELFERKKF